LIMNKIGASLIILASVLQASVLRADEARQLFWQNKILEAELSLAKSDSVYFVLDQAGGLIQFKAKGIVLREWQISKFRGRPTAEPFVSTSILKKEALSIPKRKLIDPKNPKTAEEIGSYEPDSLESKDMPADYVLLLENDIEIHVSSGQEKFISFMKHWEYSLEYAVGEKAREIWWAAFKPKARLFGIYIKDVAEAKTLCWSISNGMKGLIVFNLD
jgi:hypothetical protein